MEQSEDFLELELNCARILTSLMSLNNRKHYIPGETAEKAKLRQKAIDHGLLVILMNSLLYSSNENLRLFLQEEFLERLEEQDINYYFEGNHL